MPKNDDCRPTGVLIDTNNVTPIPGTGSECMATAFAIRRSRCSSR